MAFSRWAEAATVVSLALLIFSVEAKREHGQYPMIAADANVRELQGQLPVKKLKREHSEHEEAKPKQPPNTLPVLLEEKAKPKQERCSVKNEASKTLQFEMQAAGQMHITNGTRQNTGGLILSTWAGKDFEKWRPHIDLQKTYADSYGYQHLYVADETEWAEERSATKLPPHWVKVQAMRKLLPQYEWILYLDTDAIVTGQTTSVEELWKQAHPGASAIVPDHKGWSTDTILIRNDAWGRAFVEHVWALREYCPHVPAGEQGAFHVAMFDHIVQHQSMLVANGKANDDVSVAQDQGNSCCTVRDTCFKENPKHLYPHSAQGCTWNWQETLGFLNGNGQTPHMAWITDLRTQLGIKHPCKKLPC